MGPVVAAIAAKPGSAATYVVARRRASRRSRRAARQAPRRRVPNCATADRRARWPTKTAATEEQIKAEFTCIAAEPAGEAASYYRQCSKLHLEQATIDAVLDS